MVGLILLFEPAVGAKPVLGLGRCRMISGGPPPSKSCAWAEPKTAKAAASANVNRKSKFAFINICLFLLRLFWVIVGHNTPVWNGVKLWFCLFAQRARK